MPAQLLEAAHHRLARRPSGSGGVCRGDRGGLAGSPASPDTPMIRR